jgi:hypothetical protein
LSAQATSSAEPGWWHRAACRGLPLEWFITPGDADDESRTPDPRAQAACDRCPVREPCLDDAWRNDDVGTRGGTSTFQRRQLHRVRERLACSVCRSTDTATVGVYQYCLACGMSWRTVARHPQPR